MPLSTPASVVNPAISHPSQKVLQKVLCATGTCYQVAQAPLEELIACHPWNHLKVCVIRGLPYPTRTWTFCPALPPDRKNKTQKSCLILILIFKCWACLCLSVVKTCHSPCVLFCNKSEGEMSITFLHDCTSAGLTWSRERNMGSRQNNSSVLCWTNFV